tara:strand:+ start:7607 stop:8101 length:495 start_codon:yes stop_codon:yes gene_type:complete
MKKYYKILGLKEGATKQDIKKAFNKLSKKFDPKKNGNQDFFVEETMKLKEAYDKLMNSSILSANKMIVKSNKNDNKPTNNTNNVKPNLNPKKKSFFSKENIILVLLIVLLVHGFYLQALVISNSDEISEAKNYAQDAASYADEAASYSREARDYSFGNNCNYCP